jgi:chemotaxis signal transduction protein
MENAALSAFDLELFMPYMRDVSRCERSLQDLNLMWRLIESSAKMNCPEEARTILPTMAATRKQFSQLERELVASLIHEKLANVTGQIATKSQYIIDIVVRNLFERTADVGFLATDRQLCSFVAGISSDPELIRQRLIEYRAKYTVYDDILLLDVDGRVLVNIDESSDPGQSADRCIRDAIESRTYVERFGVSDLRPNKSQALLYAHRMLHPDTGAVIGVLCLSFRFEDEMAGIFSSHRDVSRRSIMLLLDQDHRVIASADPLWIEPGAQVPVNLDNQHRPFLFSGRNYLISTRTSPGYQGYQGPHGWIGQMMIPIDIAFERDQERLSDRLDPELLKGLLSHAETFCPPLHDIMVAARHIKQIVWNGQVMTAGGKGDLSKLKTVLEQISETGNSSNLLFKAAIDDLYETVLASNLLDAGFTTKLLVDLLDRNLYERANDCRWWALTAELRNGLANPDEQAVRTIGRVLEYINGLYTVYTRIFVYDRQGRIIASTGEPLAEDAVVSPTTLAKVAALRTTQSYYVTPFEASQFYGGDSSYEYHAAITHPKNPAQVLGGIGVVFDSRPEFDAMLRAGINRRSHMYALFASPDGTILSSTHPAHPVGSRFSMPASMPLPKAGEHISDVGIHDGQYAIFAASANAGYREFKTVDGYREDVIAVLIRHFGPVLEASHAQTIAPLQLDSSVNPHSGTEYATFVCNQQLMALPAIAVLEAVSVQAMRPASVGQSLWRRGIVRREHDGQDSYAWVFDLAGLLDGQPGQPRSDSQILIMQHGAACIGLIVDELHSVAQFAHDNVTPNPLSAAQAGLFVSNIIRANGGELAIQLLDPQRLCAAFGMTG